jgi:hypothetical protein
MRVDRGYRNAARDNIGNAPRDVSELAGSTVRPCHLHGESDGERATRGKTGYQTPTHTHTLGQFERPGRTYLRPRVRTRVAWYTIATKAPTMVRTYVRDVRTRLPWYQVVVGA